MKNQYNPKKHHRRSIRLKDYDYSQEGLYFITICVQNKICLFGKIEDSKMILNDAGEMMEKEWLKIPERFPNTTLQEYVVMPNHFHAIIEFLNNQIDDEGQPRRIASTLGDVIGAYKSIVGGEYIRGVKTMDWKPFNKRLLQRNYWEHIIRNTNSFLNISNYIKNNPANWEKDKFYMG
ncbi:MAG: transposase [Saprospiraceae bacterium]